MKPALHGYQEQAVKHLHDNPRAGLFLDMGLGKTLSVLSALTPEHLPALVIAPKRVAEHVWPAEVRKWGFDYSVALAAGTPKQRTRALASGADIVVLGRDNSGDLRGLKTQFKTVVLDELSSWKDQGTQRWKNTRHATKDAEYVWGLTGTPAPNGLLNLWAQLFLLDRGERLGTRIGSFRERYFTAERYINGRPVDWKIKPGADVRIQHLIEDICISMRAEDYLDLPPVMFNRIEVDLPPAARRAYNDFKRTLVADLSMIGSTIHTAANAAVLSGRLSQITAGFLYGDENKEVTRLHPMKVDAVREIVEGTGSPVLVFYRFVEEREALEAAFPQAKRVTDPGVIEAWSAGQVPILLAHPASAGHGLNLQGGGHTIIWTTASFSLEEYQQANARLHRQGQSHPVVVHHLIVPESIDDEILDVLQGKKTVQDALMSHLALA